MNVLEYTKEELIIRRIFGQILDLSYIVNLLTIHSYEMYIQCILYISEESSPYQ